MSMAVGGAGGPKSDINMTPMIDVLLVLIIIFMVITPLTPKGLEALVPQPPPPGQKANESDMRTVVITIDAQHQMAVNSEPTDESRWAPVSRKSSRPAPSVWSSSKATLPWSFSGSPRRSISLTAPASIKSV